MMWQNLIFYTLLALTFADPAALLQRPLVRLPRDAPRTGDHMIVADKSLPPENFRLLLARVSQLSNGATIHSYVENVAKVITASLSPYALEMIRRLDGVDHIEEEGEAQGDMYPVPWHLDRLDQIKPLLDQSYQPIGTGEGVDVYVLDSGINYNHTEFEYRAKYSGYDPYDARGLDSIPMEGWDCHGHGTHVASLCGGKIFGTAKKVTLYSVRVLGCQNAAPWSVVLDGLDYVLRIITSRMRPAIVTMSLSGDYHASVNSAVTELYQRNIPVVTVAGNGETDCCNRSPASSPHAITVAGTRFGDGLYQSGLGTNFGECVDIFAPGEQIAGADYDCKTCTKILSGTSMAAPMVTGIASIHLANTPRMTAVQLKAKLIEESLKDVIDYTGMIEDYKSITPNRLVHVTGLCGGFRFPWSQATFHTPMFPNHYLGNLNCEWMISAEEGQQVQVTFHTIRTERNFDVITVMDGLCWEQAKTIGTISGDLGMVNVTFLSRSTSLCIKFSSDTLTELIGFNATYTKLYNNTNITVVIPTIPTYVNPKPTISNIISHYNDFKDVSDVLEQYIEDGYLATWCNIYQSGEDSHADLIMTNRSNIDTICIPELGNKSLGRALIRYRESGYGLWHISTRTRGRQTVRPTFYLLLKPIPSHLEHVYYIRETESNYLDHFATNTRLNYTLLTHSFYHLDNQLYTSSAYVRDRRLALGIPTTHFPLPQWTSYHNLTFTQFETLLTTHGNQLFFPRSITTYSDVITNNTIFAVVFEEQSVDMATWFRYGLDVTTLDNLIESSQDLFKPVLSLGYNYQNIEYFYIQFIRKQEDDL